MHIVASDTHSIEHRPPQLKEAFSVIEKKFGKATADYLIKNAGDIFNNEMPDLKEPLQIKENPILKLFKR